MTALAREQTQEFAAYICDRQSAELRREIRRQELELSAMQKRSAELEAIFKRLYEDSVLGRITAEQFQSLSASYVAEQEQMKDRYPRKGTGGHQTESNGVRRRQLHLQSKAVHGHLGTDAGTAAAVH